MLKFILMALGISFLVLQYYNIKYYNPFKLIYLLGPKGSGKTTLLIKKMMRYHKKGYRIYTNLESCNLPYANIIKAEDLGYYVAQPKSMVALDEVGIIYDARRWKAFKDEWRDYYKYQRQYYNVVIVTSQMWDIDKKIKSVCDEFFLCSKLGPVCLSRKFRLKDPLKSSGDVEQQEIVFIPGGWSLTWIPKYQAYYKSFDPPVRPYLEESVYTLIAADNPPNERRRVGRRGKRPPAADLKDDSRPARDQRALEQADYNSSPSDQLGDDQT